MVKSSPQSGQTLIETMVASFILIMGITAALGLAIYSLSASSNISKQVIGVGLARESIEAVKNIRDTNWLKDTFSTGASGNGCYNYADGTQTQPCYKNWLNPVGGFNIKPPVGSSVDPVTGNEYIFLTIDINPAASNYWVVSQFDPNGCTQKYGVNYDPNAISGRFYYPVGCNVAGNSDFHRQVSLQVNVGQPFNGDLGPMVFVISRVWWTGKRCTASETYSGAAPGCRIQLESRLTNWKNY
jgi:hypothetical protein